MNCTDYIVIGLGLTGISCVDYLIAQGFSVAAMDTRLLPPSLNEIKKRYPALPLYLGENNWPTDLLGACAIVVSPGVSISHPAIARARERGADIIGDIELFARVNCSPVIAITGSNGKSTVTTLVGEMARQAGKRVAVVGNIGNCVLSMDLKNAYDLVVMELSSFQLETTSSLRPKVATVLNITEDHMDRYATFQDYINAKHRIYQHAEQAVVNQDDPFSDPPLSFSGKKWFVKEEKGSDPSEGSDPFSSFALRHHQGQRWLAKGDRLLLSESELKIAGKHNLINALSALAIGAAAGLEEAPMLTALRQFAGLPHRCQWVAKKEGIQWFNDSKGTNVGACYAAIKGLGEGSHGKIVLILGGDGKGADFTVLRKIISQYCRAILIKGKDADRIQADLQGEVPLFRVQTMQEAVYQARQCAKAGDTVLLSPACASLDQYQDYAHRGKVFMDAVKDI